MATIYTEVEVDVDLDDFDTVDLIDELERRDVAMAMQNKQLIQQIYEARQLGKDYQKLLDDLIYETIGRL
jgi:hypothetical protein